METLPTFLLWSRHYHWGSPQSRQQGSNDPILHPHSSTGPLTWWHGLLKVWRKQKGHLYNLLLKNHRPHRLSAICSTVFCFFVFLFKYQMPICTVTMDTTGPDGRGLMRCGSREYMFVIQRYSNIISMGLGSIHSCFTHRLPQALNLGYFKLITFQNSHWS